MAARRAVGEAEEDKYARRDANAASRSLQAQLQGLAGPVGQQDAVGRETRDSSLQCGVETPTVPKSTGAGKGV